MVTLIRGKYFINNISNHGFEASLRQLVSNSFQSERQVDIKYSLFQIHVRIMKSKIAPISVGTSALWRQKDATCLKDARIIYAYELN